MSCLQKFVTYESVKTFVDRFCLLFFFQLFSSFLPKRSRTRFPKQEISNRLTSTIGFYIARRTEVKHVLYDVQVMVDVNKCAENRNQLVKPKTRLSQLHVRDSRIHNRGGFKGSDGVITLFQTLFINYRFDFNYSDKNQINKTYNVYIK